jgi:hypothetical protein
LSERRPSPSGAWGIDPARLGSCRRIARNRIDCQVIIAAFGGRACHAVAVRATGRQRTSVDLYDCPLRRRVPPRRFAAGAELDELVDLLTRDCPLAEGIYVCDGWIWGDFDFGIVPLRPASAALGVRESPLSESEARAFTNAFARELQWEESRLGVPVRSRMPGPCRRMSDDRIDCELLRQESDGLFQCRFVVSTVRLRSGFAETRPYACPVSGVPTTAQETWGESLLEGIYDFRRWFCGWRPADPFETLDPDAPQDGYCGPGGWGGIPDGGRPKNRYVCWYRTVLRMHRHSNGRLHRHEREVEKCVRV